MINGDDLMEMGSLCTDPVHTLDNLLSGKYQKKYLATSMSGDLEGTKVLLRTL